MTARCVLAWWLVALVACGGKGAGSEEAQDEEPLPEQPAVRDGVRSIYEMDLGAVPASERAAALTRAEHVIRRRLALTHVVGHVAIENEKLVIDLDRPDPEAFQRARELITREGKLEVHVVDAGSDFMRSVSAQLTADADAVALGITAGTDRWRTAAGATGEDVYLWAPDLRRDSGRTAIEQQLAKRGVHAPADREIVFEHVVRDIDHALWRTYLVERKPALVAAPIRRAQEGTDHDLDRVMVTVELDRRGKEALRELTAHHIGDKLAIMLDGRVLSAPLIEASVEYLALPLGRPESPSSRDEAQLLAHVLLSGPLPAPMTELARARLVNGVVQNDQ